SFANDNLAAGALLASQRAGLHIPKDCAVMGFGDYAFAEMMLPSLTTIKPASAGDRRTGRNACA
ncbi:LacI family transcriptional regulator, partial [Pseudomonas savastanoi pv. glycinea str. race 4]